MTHAGRDQQRPHRRTRRPRPTRTPGRSHKWPSPHPWGTPHRRGFGPPDALTWPCTNEESPPPSPYVPVRGRGHADGLIASWCPPWPSTGSLKSPPSGAFLSGRISPIGGSGGFRSENFAGTFRCPPPPPLKLADAFGLGRTFALPTLEADAHLLGRLKGEGGGGSERDPSPEQVDSPDTRSPLPSTLPTSAPRSLQPLALEP